MFCLLTDGAAPLTPLLLFRVRAIQSFVGHAILIVLNSNKVATHKQQWNRIRPVNQRLPKIYVRVKKFSVSEHTFSSVICRDDSR